MVQSVSRHLMQKKASNISSDIKSLMSHMFGGTTIRYCKTTIADLIVQLFSTSVMQSFVHMGSQSYSLTVRLEASWCIATLSFVCPVMHSVCQSISATMTQPFGHTATKARRTI